MLPYGDGNRALAHDVNEAGVTVGMGKNDGGGYVAADLEPRGAASFSPATPVGGWVNAVNEAGVAVGVMRDVEAGGKVVERAGLFDATPGSGGTYLQDLLPPDSPWVLDEAVDVNDQGQVVGRMHHVDTPWENHGFLIDLSYEKGPRIVDFSVEHMDLPSENWIQVPDTGTYDGNLVRLRVNVTNTSDYPTSARIEVLDASGEVVPGGTLGRDPDARGDPRPRRRGRHRRHGLDPGRRAGPRSAAATPRGCPPAASCRRAWTRASSCCRARSCSSTATRATRPPRGGSSTRSSRRATPVSRGTPSATASSTAG